MPERQQHGCCSTAAHAMRRYTLALRTCLQACATFERGLRMMWPSSSTQKRKRCCESHAVQARAVSYDMTASCHDPPASTCLRMAARELLCTASESLCTTRCLCSACTCREAWHGPTVRRADCTGQNMTITNTTSSVMQEFAEEITCTSTRRCSCWWTATCSTSRGWVFVRCWGVTIKIGLARPRAE